VRECEPAKFKSALASIHSVTLARHLPERNVEPLDLGKDLTGGLKASEGVDGCDRKGTRA
jgi:hypothetical protein